MKRLSYLFFLLFASMVFADEVRVEPLEYWQHASSWQDPLTVSQLLESSLYASGLSGDDVSDYQDRFQIVLTDFRMSFLPRIANMNEREKGEQILEWMHEELLTGLYRTDQTKIHVLLDRGDYNCVSSALVYLVLTREAGLDSGGEETTDHAFCTISLGNGDKVDVETTTLLGFDPGTKKEFSAEFSGRTGFAYVAPGDYRFRESASDKKMVSLILQNRIALHQRRGEYNEAVGPAVDRWFFLPSEENRRDMNDAFRNHVSGLNGKGRFIDALEFLLPLSRELDLLEDNRDLIAVLYLNQAITLSNENKLDEGEAILREGEGWLESEQISEQLGIINDKRAQIAVNQKEYSEALVIIRTMMAEDTISESRGNELITWLHQNRAMEMLQEKGTQKSESYREVLAFFDGLPQEERELSGINDHRAKYRQNWAVLIHNRFAALMNGGKYEEADALLSEALEIDGHPMLLEDRDFLKKNTP